ncbi:HI1506-related protein [Halomonas stenophila]|uniref:Mu-like prophage FluMu N-terminal domain-containing protein n=1 Tax=Halomonas stenophila TaxID=795312 RepID=A0A7W5EUP2_9GAMM|nr:HI1506-related protein [Halomonas stenophila]MBB3231708.1 hypothetical protein [Halomonas stenophila]
MTTRKPTSKTASKAAQPKAQAAEEKAQPQGQDTQAAPVQDEATQTKDAATQESATNAPAKDGPSQGEAIQVDAKTAAKDPKDSRTPGEIPAVFVRTRKRYGSRRRAGFRFTREGHGIALSALTDEQLEQLHADPTLEVEECTFPAEDDGEPEA